VLKDHTRPEFSHFAYYMGEGNRGQRKNGKSMIGNEMIIREAHRQIIFDTVSVHRWPISGKSSRRNGVNLNDGQSSQ
jgi:hypothetical protein